MDLDFPCVLSVSEPRRLARRLTTFDSTISVPLPTHRLASSALRTLSVDAELSPLVRRSFSLISDDENRPNGIGNEPNSSAHLDEADTRSGDHEELERLTVLRTEYKATTNRMLRVAVNGFMESLGVVLGVMEELDVDVLAQQR